MRYVADVIHRFLQGRQLEPEEVLWGLLICAFLFSSVHLITMFVTRWGDRRVTGKALLFSLMLHFAIAIGVVAVPMAPGIPGGGAGEDQKGLENEHRIVIHSVSDAVDREARDGKANGAQAPVWDRLPAAKTTKLMGPEPQTPSAALPKNLNRIEDRPQPAELKPPDLASLPENQQPPPTAAQEAASLIQHSAKIPEIEVPKSLSKSPPEPRVPLLPQRDAATGRSAKDFNVKRQLQPQGLEPGNGARHREAGLPTDTAALPAATSPQPTATPSAASEPTAVKATPAPTALSTSEPVLPTKQASPSAKLAAGNGATMARDPVNAHISEGRWMANVDRLRSSDLTPTSPPQSAPPVGNYQSVDPRPAAPSPEIQKSGIVPLIVRRSAGVAPTYRLRKLSNRKANARQFGGNDQSERAVEASLRWLASVQNRDGSWEAKAFGAGQVKIDENGVDRDYAGRDADSGVTALSILAFLGAGYTHEEGQYADNVDRALRWLIGQQRADGNLGAGAGHFAMMYCHGIATYAVAEAYGMQNDPTSNTMLRDPLVRAVRFILDNQNPDGGWRYEKGQKSDISMFGWQLMALKSAEIAGVKIPFDAKSRMVGFLKERSLGDHGGLAAYRDGESPTASMTAEALFCKQMLGIRRDNASSQEAAEYLLARLPKRAEFNEYYWYYGTVAMYQFGGAGWQSWNEAVRAILVSEQQTGGDFAGSWEPIGPWAKYGGRIYATALSTLCLEVYYRFLPLYQIGSAVTD
jgi:prenyltransferase beta subunit